MRRPPSTSDPAAERLARALAGAPRRHLALTVPGPSSAPPGPPAGPGPAWLEERLARARSVAEGGAFVDLWADAARREAVAAQGPLAGCALAVKDLLAVAGHRVGAGSALRDGAPAEAHDAPVVAALRAAGAILVGAVALDELAFGVTGVNLHLGRPANPLDPDRVAGGSSSGSAVAVAAGAADVALGTDTGGSVRIPAALCGVVGLKPSFGRLSTAGVQPLAPSLDHVGLLARSLEDLLPAAAALGLTPRGIDRPPRLGLPAGELDAADAPVRAALQDALDRLRRAGAEVVEVAPADPARLFAASSVVLFAEAAAVHAADRAEAPELLGTAVAARLATGAALPATALVAANAERARLRAALVALDGAGIDALVGPTVPVLAPRAAELDDPERATAAAARLVAGTRLANLSGRPAISLPLGGPGPALQLVAREDHLLLGLAAWAADALG